MPKSCSAFNCKNRYSNKHPEITFHSKPSILNEWLKNIGRDDFQPRKHMVICSLHFTSDCFSGLGNRKNLLWNAVPTVFTALPQDLEKNISKKRVKRTSSVYKEDSTVGNAGIPVIADTALQSTKVLTAADHTYALPDTCTTKARMLNILDINWWLQRRVQMKCRVIKRMKHELKNAKRKIIHLQRKLRHSPPRRFTASEQV